MSSLAENQKGSIPIFIVIAVVGFILFLVIANLVTFKDQIFNTFFPKPQSQAAPLTPPVTPEPGLNLTFHAYLQNVQEIPSTTSSAWGVGVVVLASDMKSATLSLELHNLTEQTAAHIHGPAFAGETGNVLFTLPNGNFADFTIPVTPAQADGLLLGKWYFNIQTNAEPNGAIRGQVMRDISDSIYGTREISVLPLIHSKTQAQGTLKLSLVGYDQENIARFMLSGKLKDVNPSTRYQLGFCSNNTATSCGLSGDILLSDANGNLNFGGILVGSEDQSYHPTDFIIIQPYLSGCYDRICMEIPFTFWYPPFEGDILNTDGKVDIFDYNILLRDYGLQGLAIPGDIVQNQKVDIFDYNALLRGYGKVRATQGGKLSFFPDSYEAIRNCSITVEVMVDTGLYNTIGTDAEILFDPGILTYVSSIPSDFYPEVLIDDRDVATGRLHVSGLAFFGAPKSGRGKLLTVGFKVNANAPKGTYAINFDFDPNDPTKQTDSNMLDDQGSSQDRLFRATKARVDVLDEPSCPN